jgi:hypothetical protein
MADDGLNGGAAAHLLFDRRRDAAFLAGCIDFELVLGRRIVAAVSGIGVEPFDRIADELLDRLNTGMYDRPASWRTPNPDGKTRERERGTSRLGRAIPLPTSRHRPSGGIAFYPTRAPPAHPGFLFSSAGYPKFRGPCCVLSACVDFGWLRFRRPMLRASTARRRCGRTWEIVCSTMAAGTELDAMKRTAVGPIGRDRSSP